MNKVIASNLDLSMPFGYSYESLEESLLGTLVVDGCDDVTHRKAILTALQEYVRFTGVAHLLKRFS